MADSTDVPTPEQLQLALERTYLPHERTMMAWVRTATSLIAFGFTLYKTFYYLHQNDPVKHPEQPLGARVFGILMIAIGMVTLLLAAWQHQQQMKQLRVHYPNAPFSLSLVVTVLIAMLGLVAIAATVFTV